MPFRSQAQRAAAHAAAEGKSTIGMPQSVGKELVADDPGGKLPEHVGEKRKGKIYTHSRAMKG